MKPPLISILIVTWNNEKDISGSLKSLLDSTYKNFNITLVDNASSDDTVEIIRKNFPMVHIIKMEENKYYTGGLNAGIKYIQENLSPKYILFLNADIIADKNMLQELLNVAEDYEIGGVKLGQMGVLEAGRNLIAVGPKNKYFDDPEKIYSIGIDFDGFMNACQHGTGEIDKGQFDLPQKVFGVEGTCVLLKVENLKRFGNKPFWERLKMYYEDVEFFIRAKKFGLVSITAPKAVLYHKVMVSTNQNPMLKLEEVKKKNWLLIALRHYNLKSKLAMLRKYLFT